MLLVSLGSKTCQSWDGYTELTQRPGHVLKEWTLPSIPFSLCMYIHASAGGYSNPLRYSNLENPMDRETWRPTVHGVAKSQTQLRNQAQHSIYTHVLSNICMYLYILVFLKYLCVYTQPHTLVLLLRNEIYCSLFLNPFTHLLIQKNR